MNSHSFPRGVKLAIHVMRRDPARAWTVDELAAACGLARRTMQTQFRRFLGAAPLEFLRLTRLAEARRRLMQAEPRCNRHQHCCRLRLQSSSAVSLDGIASATAKALRQLSIGAGCGATCLSISLPGLLPRLERPPVAVLPFELIGPAASRAIALQDEIATALCATR